MTRDQVFDSLHVAHARAWERPPTNSRWGHEGPAHTTTYGRFHAWRMAWWRELERAFPDKIKNGVRHDSPAR